MLFSELFGVTPTEDDDWFDVVLSIDTPLFLDPFLVYAEENGIFEGSHDEIIRFFDLTFKLIAQARDKESPRYLRAVNDLLFPEIEELCLGYTRSGTGGAGSASEIAALIADGLSEAIEAGLEEITHFEEVGIFRENIGADRISDATAGILKWRLAAYTKQVCDRHNIETKTFRHLKGRFDAEAGLWVPLEMQLPANPNNGKGILLVPRRYIRSLPTINAEDFWDYCSTNENDVIRNNFSFDITSRVSKKDIVDLARRRPDFVRDYLRDVEKREGEPYDFEKDRDGLVGWYLPTKDYCAQNPLVLDAVSRDSLLRLIDESVNMFGRFIERDDGWRLLWKEDRTCKDQQATQLLFLGIVKHYCHANEIGTFPEDNIGKGAVTFTAKDGTSVRILLELKLARTTRFWNSVRDELPEYKKARGCDACYFVVVSFLEKDDGRVIEIRKCIKALREDYGFKTVEVDASSDESEVWSRYQPITVTGKNAQVHIGDNYTTNGDIVGSAVGPGASVDAGDISVTNGEPGVQPVDEAKEKEEEQTNG